MIYLIQNICSNAGTLEYLENGNLWVFPKKFLKTWAPGRGDNKTPVGILSTVLTDQIQGTVNTSTVQLSYD